MNGKELQAVTPEELEARAREQMLQPAEPSVEYILGLQNAYPYRGPPPLPRAAPRHTAAHLAAAVALSCTTAWGAWAIGDRTWFALTLGGSVFLFYAILRWGRARDA